MKLTSLALGLALVCAAAPALAANVDVQLLNKGDKGAFVFQPDLVKIGVGDTVTFEATTRDTTSMARPRTSRPGLPRSRAR
jgi:plastocyanin